MTPESFVRQLRLICDQIGSLFLSLSVDDTKTWPHFTITGTGQQTAMIRGWFVENGDSFWQVGESGREDFTADSKSSDKLLSNIRLVVRVLAHEGCWETRWRNRSGQINYATIEIMDTDGTPIRLGRRPPFWMVGLVEEKKRYEPYVRPTE